MNLINLVRFHLKRIVKTPSLLGSFVLMPLFMTAFMVGLQMLSSPVSSSNSSTQTIAIVAGENNELLQDALDRREYGDAFVETIAEGQALLDRAERRAVYVLPDSYLETPDAQVRILARKGDVHNVAFEAILQDELSRLRTDKVLQTYNVLAEGDTLQVPDNQMLHLVTAPENATVLYMMVVIMIIIYTFTNGVSVGSDLVNFKKNHVLRRSIVTPNNSATISLSFLLTYFVCILFVNAAVMTAIGIWMKWSLHLLLVGYVVVATAAFISIAFGLCLFRLLKDPGVCMAVGMVTVMAIIGIGIMQQFVDNEQLKMLSMLSPLSWLLRVIETGEIFPHLFVPLLMAVVLFTAGTYKLDRYAIS